MRYFFRRRVPEPSHILLIESGSRRISEIVIANFRMQFGDGVKVDLVTCFAGSPAAMAENPASVYDVNDYSGRAGRLRLVRELRTRRYPIAAIVCSRERILGRWKWVLAAALPSKLLVINENGDYFWLDRAHWPAIRQFVKHRAGLVNAGIVRGMARIIAFPFTFFYLLLYATAAHFRRALYRGFR